VLRDRTFFFGSYEGLREETERSSVANVLSAAARQGVLTVSRSAGGGVPAVPGGITAGECTNAVNRGTLSADGSACTIPISAAVRPYLSLWPVVGEAG